MSEEMNRVSPERGRCAASSSCLPVAERVAVREELVREAEDHAARVLLDVGQALDAVDELQRLLLARSAGLVEDRDGATENVGDMYLR